MASAAMVQGRFAGSISELSIIFVPVFEGDLSGGGLGMLGGDFGRGKSGDRQCGRLEGNSKSTRIFEVFLCDFECFHVEGVEVFFEGCRRGIHGWG